MPDPPPNRADRPPRKAARHTGRGSRISARWRHLPSVVPLARFLGRTVFVIVIAVALSVLSRLDLLPEGPEHWTADLRTALLSPHEATPDARIAMVLITDRTLEKYPYTAPVDRGLLAATIGAVDKAGPRAIGLDFVFDRATEANKDNGLVSVIKGAEAPMVLGDVDEGSGLTQDQLGYEHDFLARVGRRVGHLYFDINRHRLIINDDVARFKYEKPHQESFSQILANIGGHQKIKEPYLWQLFFPASPYISWRLPPDDGSPTFLTLNAQTVIELAAENHLPLLKGLLGGRIVLIGVDVVDRDQHLTPLSVLRNMRFPGVFIQAQLLNQLLDHKSIYVFSRGTEFGALLLLAGCGFYLGNHFHLWREEFIVEVTGTIILVAVGFVAFAAANVIIPYTTLFLAWLAGTIVGHHHDWIRGRLGVRR